MPNRINDVLESITALLKSDYSIFQAEPAIDESDFPAINIDLGEFSVSKSYDGLSMLSGAIELRIYDSNTDIIKALNTRLKTILDTINYYSRDNSIGAVFVVDSFSYAIDEDSTNTGYSTVTLSLTLS